MTAEWGVPTPSGHTYHLPTTYKDIRERVNDFAQGEIESWDDAERCPEPTWEVVSRLLDEIERFQHIREVVENDYRSAGEACKDANGGLRPWYAGAVDALDEVRRRMEETDNGSL